MGIKFRLALTELLHCSITLSFITCVTVGIPFAVSKLLRVSFLATYFASQVILYALYVTLSSANNVRKQFRIVKRIEDKIKADVPVVVTEAAPTTINKVTN